MNQLNHNYKHCYKGSGRAKELKTFIAVLTP